MGLNTRYRADDVAYTVDQSDTTTLVAIDRSGPVDYRSMLAEVLPRLPKLRRLVLWGEDRLPSPRLGRPARGRGGGQRRDARRPPAGVDPDARSLIIYTSGTTSLPKGAVHSHIWLRNLAERAEMLGHTCNDVHLSYLPLFHAFGYSEVAAMSVLTGARQILTDVFDPDEVLDLAEAEGGTILHGFDTHWADLIRAQEARPRQLSLRLGTLAAGMESSTPVAYRSQEVFCPTVSGWGMSEVWAFVSCSHPTHSAEQRCEASGYPMADMEFRVIDPDTGADLAPASRGSCCSAATRGCRRTTASRRRPPRPSTPTAGCTPATWCASGPTATSCSWAATRTC